MNALNKADVGDVNAFVEYVGEQLVWSLEISLKAGKGQGIEEIDDVDKEIDLYKKEFPRELKNAIPKSANVIRDLVDGSLTKLFETLVMDQLKIDQMFTKSSVSVEFENKNHVLRTGSAFSSAIHEIVDQMEVTGIDSALQNFISIRFDRHNLIVGSKQISLGRSIHIKLQNLSYEIVSNGVTSLKKKYPEQLTDEEIRNFSKKTLAVTFEELKLNNK